MSAEPLLGRPDSFPVEPPAAPPAARRLVARLVRSLRHGLIALGLLAGLSMATGCSSVASAGGQQPVGDQGLIDDGATRLGGATTLTYSAVYVIGGGETGTITQALIPERTAYQYPDGMTLVEENENIVCATVKEKVTCTHKSSAAASNAAITKGGLVRPEAVVAMLTSAAQDADSIVSETDTTIAGTSATCLTVSLGSNTANQFHVCVTNDGLLGAFQGVSGGTAIDVTLDHYEMSTVAGAFDLPKGAKIVGTAP